WSRSLYSQVDNLFPRVLDESRRFRIRRCRFLCAVVLCRRLLSARNPNKKQARKCTDKKNLRTYAIPFHAPAFCALVTTSLSTASAFSHPARSTSQCVTRRTE